MRRPSNPCSMLRISWVLVLVLAVSATDDGSKTAATSAKPETTVTDVTTMMKEIGTTVKDAETTSMKATTVEATTKKSFDCTDIRTDARMEDIIEHCANETTIKFQGLYVDISRISKKLVNAFLSTKIRLEKELRMEHNTEIDELDLSSLTEFGDYNRKTLTIIDTNLRTVIMGSNAKIYGTVIVRGNRYLETASTELILKRSKKGSDDIIDIQKYPGECLIDRNNVNLKDCTRVYQNLELEDYDFEANAPNFQPEAVSGCIKIGAKANVHETMFDNLINNKFTGTECKDKMYIKACMKKSIFGKIKDAIPNELQLEDYKRKDCSFTCNFEDLKDFQQEGCDTIQGDIILDENTPGHVVSLLANVKHINGSLILNATTLESIAFDQLTTITSSAEPALTITNNDKLRVVQFRAIQKIATTGSDICIVFEGNAEITEEQSLIRQLENKAEDCETVYDRAVTEETMPITTWKPKAGDSGNGDSGGGNGNAVANNGASGQNGGQKEKEDEGMGVAGKAGIAFACLFVILLLIAVIVVGVLLWRKKKRGNTDNGKEVEEISDDKIVENQLKQKEAALATPLALHQNWIVYNEKIADEGVRARICCFMESVVNTPVLRFRQLVMNGTLHLINWKNKKKDGEAAKLGEYFNAPFFKAIRDALALDVNQYAHVNLFYWNEELNKEYVEPIDKDKIKKEEEKKDKAPPGKMKSRQTKEEVWKHLMEKYSTDTKKTNTEAGKMLVLCTFSDIPFEKYFEGMKSFKCKRNLAQENRDSGEYPSPHPEKQVPQYYTVTVGEQAITVRVHDMGFHLKEKVSFSDLNKFYNKEDNNAYANCHFVRYVHWARNNKVPFLMIDPEKALFVELVSVALFFIFEYKALTEIQLAYGAHLVILSLALDHTNLKCFNPPEVAHAYALAMIQYCLPYVCHLQKNNTHFTAWKIARFGEDKNKDNQKTINIDKNYQERMAKETKQVVEKYVNATGFMSEIVNAATDTINWETAKKETVDPKILGVECMGETKVETVVKKVDLAGLVWKADRHVHLLPVINAGEMASDDKVSKSKEKSNDKSSDAKSNDKNLVPEALRPPEKKPLPKGK